MDFEKWLTEWGPLALGWVFFAVGTVWIGKFASKHGPALITTLTNLTNAVIALKAAVDSMDDTLNEVHKSQLLLEQAVRRQSKGEE